MPFCTPVYCNVQRPWTMTWFVSSQKSWMQRGTKCIPYMQWTHCLKIFWKCWIFWFICSYDYLYFPIYILATWASFDLTRCTGRSQAICHLQWSWKICDYMSPSQRGCQTREHMHVPLQSGTSKEDLGSHHLWLQLIHETPKRQFM